MYTVPVPALTVTVNVLVVLCNTPFTFTRQARLVNAEEQFVPKVRIVLDVSEKPKPIVLPPPPLPDTCVHVLSAVHKYRLEPADADVLKKICPTEHVAGFDDPCE